MTLLNAGQKKKIRSVRTRARTRPFILSVASTIDIEDFYDETSDDAVETVLSGDWSWREQDEAVVTAGGQANRPQLVLECSSEHYAQLAQSGARLIVDGVTLRINSLSIFEDTGDLVVSATGV